MKPPHPGWLLFPILGSALSLVFRPSETDWKTFQPTQPTRQHRQHLPLPDGSVLRLLGVPDHEGNVAFWMGEREISRSEARALGFPSTGPGLSAPFSFEEALRLCRDLSEHSGRTVRLPTAGEWRQAARGGVTPAETPWGFGIHPPKGIAFARKSPPGRVGKPFGFGFRDLAGGLWEWTAEGTVIGGAWPETNPVTLRLDFSLDLQPGYRDIDVGMRVVVE